MNNGTGMCALEPYEPRHDYPVAWTRESAAIPATRQQASLHSACPHLLSGPTRFLPRVPDWSAC